MKRIGECTTYHVLLSCYSYFDLKHCESLEAYLWDAKFGGTMKTLIGFEIENFIINS